MGEHDSLAVFARASSDVTMPNRVHRRVIVSDYGKAIYKSSSPVVLLKALEGCIQGYESLHQQGGLLQGDISADNLLVDEEGNGSWFAFLIDLDFAIEVSVDGTSEARPITGTRPFMAIRVLEGEKHSFMHDLEAFFWVLCWICIHYEGPNKGRVVPSFEEWNYKKPDDLATTKAGLVVEQERFLKKVTENFTDYYKPLIQCANRLRREVFPGGRPWQREEKKLYSQMRKVLQEAQRSLGAGSSL